MIDPYGEGQLLIQGVGLSGGGNAYGNTRDMRITDGIPVINSISADINNGYQRMYVLGSQGNFQLGHAPASTHLAGLFSLLASRSQDTLVSMQPVPGPISAQDFQVS
jgi:hypothetical protein